MGFRASALLVTLFFSSVLGFAQSTEAENDLCARERAHVEYVSIAPKLVDGLLPYDGGLAPGQIALTFDDGPNPLYNERIRASLAECGVKATFFFVGHHLEGRRAERYANLIRETAAEGHQVASHSMSHGERLRLGNLVLRGIDANREELEHEIFDAHNLVMAAAGTRTPFFRFPYGNGARIPEALAYIATKGLISFFWNMSTGDSPACASRREDAEVDVERVRCSRPTSRQVLRHTINEVTNNEGGLRGGILLAHERGNTTPVVPQIIRHLMRHGATFVVFTP